MVVFEEIPFLCLALQLVGPHFEQLSTIVFMENRVLSGPAFCYLIMLTGLSIYELKNLLELVSYEGGMLEWGVVLVRPV